MFTSCFPQEGRIQGAAHDDYDDMVLDLANEAKARPSDRMKTATEIAQEERDRLQQLEEKRLRRMRGEGDEAQREEAFDAEEKGSSARLEVGIIIQEAARVVGNTACCSFACPTGRVSCRT